MKVVLGKGDEILDIVAAAAKGNPVGSMGPNYVGTIVEMFFLGILGNQVLNYYSYFPKDSPWVRRLVGIVFVLSLFKAFQACTIAWDKNIIGFGDWRIAIAAPWNLWIQPPACALISTTAQSFFVWRCFTLTGRNWWLLGFLISSMLAVVGLAIACGIHTVYDPYYSPGLIPLAIPMLTLGTLVDVVITAVVSLKLAKSRSGFNKDTDTLLKKLMAITWEAAIPPTISQTLNMILFLTMGQRNSWHGAMNMVTPSLYVFSLMHTLNSRATIRLGSSFATSGDASQEAGVITVEAQRRRTGNVMTLSTFNKKDRKTVVHPASAMPVHVQKENLARVSVMENHHADQVVLGDSEAGNDGKVMLPSEDDLSLASARWERDPKVRSEADSELAFGAYRRQ